MDKRYLSPQVAALKGISKGKKWVSGEVDGTVYLTDEYAFWVIPKEDYYLSIQSKAMAFNRLAESSQNTRPGILTNEILAVRSGFMRVVTDQTTRYFYDTKYIKMFPDKNVEYRLGKEKHPILFVFEQGKLLGGILPVSYIE